MAEGRKKQKIRSKRLDIGYYDEDARRDMEFQTNLVLEAYRNGYDANCVLTEIACRWDQEKESLHNYRMEYEAGDRSLLEFYHEVSDAGWMIQKDCDRMLGCVSEQQTERMLSWTSNILFQMSRIVGASQEDLLDQLGISYIENTFATYSEMSYTHVIHRYLVILGMKPLAFEGRSEMTYRRYQLPEVKEVPTSLPLLQELLASRNQKTSTTVLQYDIKTQEYVTCDKYGRTNSYVSTCMLGRGEKTEGIPCNKEAGQMGFAKVTAGGKTKAARVGRKPAVMSSQK